MVRNKYKYFRFRLLLLFFASFLVTSCGLFYDSLILSQEKVGTENVTNADTISVNTVFYFGLISKDGLDRFEQDIFQELFFDLMAKKNTLYPSSEIFSLEKRLERKPFKLVYVMDATLVDTLTIAQKKVEEKIEQKVKDTELLLGPKNAKDSISNDETLAEVKVLSSLLLLKEKSINKEKSLTKSDLVYIVSCLRTYNGDPLKHKEHLEQISGYEIDYFEASGWNRFYVNNQISLSEVKEIFPEAWPCRYGE